MAVSDVSVVLCTYNGSRHIRDQVTSLLAQTLPPYELLVADDGSSDDTLAQIDGLASAAPFPVRVVRNPARLGYADNFLQAAHRTKGRFVAFCDQDDRWHPEKLRRTRTALVESEALLCVHQVNLMDGEGKSLGHYTQSIDSTHVIEPLTFDPWGVFLGFTQLFDRRLIDVVPFRDRGRDSFDPSQVLSHDRWMTFLASNLGKIVALQDRLADYRQHGSNLFGVRPFTLLDRFRIKSAEGAPKLRSLEITAKHRLDLLSSIVDPPNPDVLPAAIRHWQTLYRHCARRHRLYVERHLPVRAALIAGNLLSGTYKNYAGRGLGHKRLLEDVSLGLFGPMLLKAGAVTKR